MWLLYYGRKLGMQKREILCTSYVEMCDMIACMAIDNGAEPKRKARKVMRFEDVMLLR